MTIGKKIKELRESSGLLQRELASKLDIGEGFLSKIENNQKNVKREDLEKISKIFKTPINELEKLWLANKLYCIVRDEKQGLNALRVAEKEIIYNKKH